MRFRAQLYTRRANGFFMIGQSLQDELKSGIQVLFIYIYYVLIYFLF